MLKKTILYTDLDGNAVTEDFYFNLSIPEIVSLATSENGNVFNLITKMTETSTGSEILVILEAITRLAVGKRSDDNRRFMKSEEITSEFFDSQAYEAFYVELITDEKAMSDFINAVIPADKLAEVLKMLSANDEEGQTTTDVELPDAPAWVAEGREPTSAEMMTMSKEQLVEAYRIKNARVLSEASSIVPERRPSESI